MMNIRNYTYVNYYCDGHNFSRTLSGLVGKDLEIGITGYAAMSKCFY